MTIAWTSFTPLSSFVGGCLIGLAALLLMAIHGRVMGVSGIVGGLFEKYKPAEFGWRFAFLSGVIIAPIAWEFTTKTQIVWQAAASGPQFYIAAFLVGLGTAIGSGCTSGHGICGLARLSKRSFVAVISFTTSAVVTVAIINVLRGGT